jgi:hypothetical protein
MAASTEHFLIVLHGLLIAPHIVPSGQVSLDLRELRARPHLEAKVQPLAEYRAVV